MSVSLRVSVLRDWARAYVFILSGTSRKTNFYAMETIKKNTIFTNVAETSDGGVFWEGLEEELPPGVRIKSWMGDDDWSADSRDKPAAHPNSR